MKNLRKMVQASLFAALTVVCAWIAIPIPPIGVTLQTFALLLALGTLGGCWGTVSIGLYLLLGLVGVPVFAGFRGGAAALLDPTGGFLWGFLLGAIAYRLVEKLGTLTAMLCALGVCYLCGCAWFSYYAGGTGLIRAFTVCVLPYLTPDSIKLWLVCRVSRRLRRHLPFRT